MIRYITYFGTYINNLHLKQNHEGNNNFNNFKQVFCESFDKWPLIKSATLKQTNNSLSMILQ